MKPESHAEWTPLFALGFDYPSKVLKTIKPKVVFDIGANEGGYVPVWKEYGAEKVFAVEPVPNMAQKIRERFKDDSGVVVMQMAVSDASGSMKNVNVYNTWSLAEQGKRRDITVEYKDSPPFDVEIVTIDNIGGTSNPDFIKLDVDGYDYRAILGMKRILTTIRPPIFFEFSHLPKFILGDDPQAMCNHIYNLNYSAVSVDGWVCPDAKIMMTMYPEGSSYDIMLMPTEKICQYV